MSVAVAMARMTLVDGFHILSFIRSDPRGPGIIRDDRELFDFLL
jgi:hypothetical protein